MPELDKDRIRDFVKQFRVEPGRSVRLPRDFDPGDTSGFRRRTRGTSWRGGSSCSASTRRGSPPRTRGLLVIIQAIDAAGRTARSAT